MSVAERETDRTGAVSFNGSSVRRPREGGELTDFWILCIAEQREPVVDLFHFDRDRGARLMIAA